MGSTAIRYDSQFERGALHGELLEDLKEGLHALDDLRLVPHNDLYVVRLKRHLRQKITELERESFRARYEEAAS